MSSGSAVVSRTRPERIAALERHAGRVARLLILTERPKPTENGIPKGFA
jgi:hypothetical protein